MRTLVIGDIHGFACTASNYGRAKVTPQDSLIF
jgi:hypothetical protein